MNLDFYNSLPDDLKTILSDGFGVWAQAVQDYTDGNLEMYDKTFTDYGCTMIHLTDDARQEFRRRHGQRPRRYLARSIPTSLPSSRTPSPRVG
jgi:TRAP-type C4-dicarboxylate transport system substrate-binding protein